MRARRHSKRSFSFFGNQRGSAAVEFALVCPVFILLMTGVFSGGMVFHVRETNYLYAREAARGLALGYFNETEAKDYAEDQAEDALGIDVTVSVDPATVGDPTDQNVVVSISVTKNELEKLAPFGGILPDGMTATVTMRNTITS
ncbi:hypothetical protein PB2503_04012 [Parvularcula bermudensis HTCC2503]|uniref:TadE-like domain-containing protein n=1 Tax=Parvularcula bermudensis (strain ATCC BAA-594 / HTCC2503 / KCTC 12087) TaxID=314260 RepID=E0TE56_PARBH|nr:TadE/TadG family type IV pilus assembly protein [Parvularcula bermudensis]ADM08877.1 hypothetical protein PB2503_04012 [Parvularcula bermudensis HTCC2503]